MHSYPDFPLVSPGVRVTIQLKSGRYYQTDDQGNRIGPDHFLSTPPTDLVVNYADQCYPEHWPVDYETKEEAMHSQTICTDCISSWAEDYYIVLADSQSPLTEI